MTQAELNAYEARRSKSRTGGETSGCNDESELHDQILAECRRRGWIAFHGSMAHATKRTEGEPDFLIVGNKIKAQYNEMSGWFNAPSPFVLMVECKTKTSKLSPAQQAIAAHAAKLGHTVHVVRSFEDFLKLL